MSTKNEFKELSLQVLCLVRKKDIRYSYLSKKRVKYGVPGIAGMSRGKRNCP
ncbi:MAG: hypothetical protein IT392_11585 [Nitrospirae bacterium]|nr:hypothetical protein [Nitrospirota bacterium]